MAEINAACDEWISEIRRGVTAQIRPMASTQPTRGAPVGSDLGPGGVVATLTLMVLITALVVGLAGWSSATLAAGALVGASAGAAFLVVLHRLGRR